MPRPARPLYPQFIHVLLNDSQYLLQEALNKLPQVHCCGAGLHRRACVDNCQSDCPSGP